MNGKVVSLDSNFFEHGETYLGKDGGVIKFNLENIPTPPLHPNCRCTIVPITVSQRMVGQGRVEKRESQDIDAAEMKKEIVAEVEESIKRQLNDIVDKL